MQFALVHRCLRDMFPAVLAIAAGACVSVPVESPAPDPMRLDDRVVAPRLPVVPLVDGPLALVVQYPPAGATITARDSNFIFGATGSGRAQLAINGETVAVAPNGAFLGFIPVPPDGVYRLSATVDTQSAALEHTVRVPDTQTQPAVAIVAPYPTGAVAVQYGETIEIGLRARRGVAATALLPDGTRIALLERGAVAEEPGDEFRTEVVADSARPFVRYAGRLRVTTPIAVPDPSVPKPRIGSNDVPAPENAPLGAAIANPIMLEVVSGVDTARTMLRLNVGLLNPGAPRVGIVTAPPDAPPDWTIRGRLDTAGPFHFFWPPGTRLTITGERDGFYRIRLTDSRTAWVPASEVVLLADGAIPASATVAAVRFSPQPEYIDLRIPLPDRLPFQVDGADDRLHIDVFGAVSHINFFQYGRLDPFIERAEWSQPSDDVLRISIDLARDVWGYVPFYDAGGALVLRIRRPPAIDPVAPLRGLFIGVDAGHGGEDRSTRGPTDMREADANLGIALQLRDLLERAGARVMMTRSIDTTVPLNDRPRMAADSGVHVLVSVHNNAFPDGVNPWTNNGTSAYYYHPYSADLARAMQMALLAELGLRDIGYGRADLALVRPTWMPAVLTETAFMMIPQQEAALRDPAVQQRIAAAHVRGLEAFLRARARN